MFGKFPTDLLNNHSVQGESEIIDEASSLVAQKTVMKIIITLVLGRVEGMSSLE